MLQVPEFLCLHEAVKNSQFVHINVDHLPLLKQNFSFCRVFRTLQQSMTYAQTLDLFTKS